MLTRPARQEAGMCFLTEKEPVWAGMLADVLAQKGIPFVKESSLGAGMALRAGPYLRGVAQVRDGPDLRHRIALLSAYIIIA